MPSTSVNIGGSNTSLTNAAVVYAPLSNVSLSSLLLFEGSAVGWNVTINAPGVVEDLDLGNYSLSSVVNSYQIAQNVQCDVSVTNLTTSASDLNGC